MKKNEHHGGPVDRLEWLGTVIDDDRARAPHIRIAKHIIARYYAKFGNARASVSFLQTATGYTRGTVASATADLESWGYYSRKMGAGTRPTEYYPDFSVLEPQDSCVLPSPNTTPSSVLQRQDQTHLRNPVTNGFTYRDASAPHALGLAASTAGAGLVEVLKSEIESRDGDTVLDVHIETEDGAGDIITFVVESDNADRQENGQHRLERLSQAINIRIEAPSDLIGARFCFTETGEFLPPHEETAA
ncbi:hypothetical protein A8A54_10035 [Brucella pseudogrignonensis]|nr:hypothetical protein A8A54_10035 [Brucella pseudogrignonensis]